MSIRPSPSSGGAELGYASITSDFASTSAYPTRTDVTGLSITVVHGSRPIVISFGTSHFKHGTSGQVAIASLMEGATELTFIRHLATAVNSGNSSFGQARVAADPGVSHTYKVALATGSTGTATFGATATTPAFIHAREV